MLISEEDMVLYTVMTLEIGDIHRLVTNLATVVLRAYGVSEIFGKTGLDRGFLYRMLSEDSHPRLGTVLKILKIFKHN